MMTVSVVSTGNELLYGAAADTNSGYICSRLFPLGVRVASVMTVGDDIDAIARAVRHGLDLSGMVIMTGGLGPTDDDNTIAALGRIFTFDVVEDPGSLGRMELYLGKLGLPLAARDLKMIQVPSTARVIENMIGLAPGFILAGEDKTVIALPGVPREMAEMMERSVIPCLKEEWGLSPRASAAFRVVGMKESDVNEAVATLGPEGRGLAWGITASEGIATVTLVENGGALDPDRLAGEMRALFGVRLLGGAYRSPEEEVLALLGELGMTLSCAESCTGGLVSGRLTGIPGSSEVFAGSVVAYANDAKAAILGVSPGTIAGKGAVSAETAGEMAAGARSLFGTDIAVSVTGIAGPGGGTEAKPVGTVWFGLAFPGGVRTFTRTIPGDRERVRALSALIAIEAVREYLLEQTGNKVV